MLFPLLPTYIIMSAQGAPPHKKNTQKDATTHGQKQKDNYYYYLFRRGKMKNNVHRRGQKCINVVHTGGQDGDGGTEPIRNRNRGPLTTKSEAASNSQPPCHAMNALGTRTEAVQLHLKLNIQRLHTLGVCVVECWQPHHPSNWRTRRLLDARRAIRGQAASLLSHFVRLSSPSPLTTACLHVLQWD